MLSLSALGNLMVFLAKMTSGHMQCGSSSALLDREAGKIQSSREREQQHGWQGWHRLTKCGVLGFAKAPLSLISKLLKICYNHTDDSIFTLGICNAMANGNKRIKAFLKPTCNGQILVHLDQTVLLFYVLVQWNR